MAAKVLTTQASTDAPHRPVHTVLDAEADLLANRRRLVAQLESAATKNESTLLEAQARVAKAKADLEASEHRKLELALKRADAELTHAQRGQRNHVGELRSKLLQSAPDAAKQIQIALTRELDHADKNYQAAFLDARSQGERDSLCRRVEDVRDALSRWGEIVVAEADPLPSLLELVERTRPIFDWRLMPVAEPQKAFKFGG